MSKSRKFLISLFVLFSILAMVENLLPMRPLDAYLSFFSLHQEWKMFAPDSNKSTVYVTADIEFDDGSTASYDFEHWKNNNVITKYSFGEKYRKYVTDGLSRDDRKWMYQDAAKFALRKVRGENFYKIPLKVHLTRHSSTTPERYYTYEVIR